MLLAKKVGLRTARCRTCVNSVSTRSRFEDATFLSGTGEVSQEPRANSGNLWILWTFYGYFMDILWIFYGHFMDILWTFYGHFVF